MNQKGIISPQLLLTLAVLGLVGYLVIATNAPFKDQVLNTINPKPESHAAEDFTCTLVLGYSITQQWFADSGTFEQAVDNSKWELKTQGGASARYWADPNYGGWFQGTQSACALNADTPDRILLDITRDEYRSDVGIFVSDIQGWIATARQKYPSVRQFIIQPIMGSPDHQICPWSAQFNAVRASYNHPTIWQAISQVVGGDVIPGLDVHVRSCADYGDDLGHLANSEASAAAGTLIGNYYKSLVPPTSPLPTFAPTPTPVPTPVVTPPPGSVTVTFDDRAGQDQPLTGQYPSGVLDWGTGGTWLHSSPYQAFTTKSVSFSNANLTSGVVTVLGGRRLISLDAFNGGTVGSAVTLGCSGQTTRTFNLPVGQVQNLATNWTGACSVTTITSSNAWNTNFDNLIISGTGGSTPAPTSVPTVAPTTTPTTAPTIAPTTPPTTMPTPGATLAPFNAPTVSFVGTCLDQSNPSAATVSWSNRSATFMDISTNNTFPTDQFYNKALTVGQTTTVAPGGFNLYPSGGSTLVFQPNTQYYARLWNGTHSPLATFTTPNLCVTATPTPMFLQGDADMDGDVDIFDYNAVLTNYGRPGPNAGDLDKDGDCDIFDYNIIMRDYGKRLP